MTLTDSGILIGDCDLQFLPGGYDSELGFHFAREYWARGYATEAASACLAVALATEPNGLWPSLTRTTGLRNTS